MKYNTISMAFMSETCTDFYICDINIFSFSGVRKKVIKSGEEKYDLTIVKNTTKSFKVDMLCPVCNENHSFLIPQSQFWSGTVYTYCCPNYEANVLYIGENSELKKTVADYLDEELSYMGKSVLLTDTKNAESLSKLLILSENDAKYATICDCGKADIAYNDKFIYFICNKCGKTKRVTYSDAEVITADFDF